MATESQAIISHDQESDPNLLDIAEADKVFHYVVRWLRTTQFFEDNPTARDVIATVVQEVIQSKPILTPASTLSSSNTPREQGTIPPLPQDIVQDETSGDNEVSAPLVPYQVDREGGFNSDTPTPPPWKSSTYHYNDNSPAARVEHEQRDRLSEYGGSPHSASPSSSILTDYEEDFLYPNTPPHCQSSELSSLQNESDDPQYRKHKHNSEEGQESKRRKMKGINTSGIKRRKRSSRSSTTVQTPVQPPLVTDKVHSRQSEILDTDKGGRPPTTAESLPEQQPTPVSCSISPWKEGERFRSLSVELRAKLQRVAHSEALITVWKYLNYKRLLAPSTDDYDNTSNKHTCHVALSSSDRRLIRLRNCFVREDKVEQFAGDIQRAARIAKMVALAEVIGRYLEEKDAWRAMPRKEKRKEKQKELPQLSPKVRFTNLLFPQSQPFDMKVEGKSTPKTTFDYWLQLGTPLARMSQRYGIAILALFAEILMDRDLYYLPRGQIDDFVDYIEWIQPGLEERTRTLSAVLPHFIENRAPPPRLVLETFTPDQLPHLRSRSLEELLQFDTEVIDSHEASVVAGTSCDQGFANEQLSYVQGTTEPVQSISPQYTSVKLRSRSSSAAGLENGCLPSPTPGRSELDHLLAGHRYQNSSSGQEPSSFQDVNEAMPLRPAHIEQPMNSNAYYPQEADWCAVEPPASCEGDSLDSQHGESQCSDPGTFTDLMDFWVTYSPPNTPSHP